MKNATTLLLFSILLLSCSKEVTNSDSRDCQAGEYDVSFDLKLDNEVCFPDGSSILLSSIEHHLCPPDAYCKWAADIYVTLSTTTMDGTEDKQFYPVAIHRNPSIFDNHQITSFSYSYDSDGGEVPPNKEDFDPKRTQLTITISKI